MSIVPAASNGCMKFRTCASSSASAIRYIVAQDRLTVNDDAELADVGPAQMIEQTRAHVGISSRAAVRSVFMPDDEQRHGVLLVSADTTCLPVGGDGSRRVSGRLPSPISVCKNQKSVFASAGPHCAVLLRRFRA